MDKTETIEIDENWGRDPFLRSLLRELMGTLERVVGLSDSEGFVSAVGQCIGDRMNRAYRTRLGRSKLDRREVTETLVDLKRRIDGDFYVAEESTERIVLRNRRCPFGEFVKDRRSLCMMTSNVFGTIAAENLGYARVTLAETIAGGHEGCHVIIHLTEASEETESDDREYFSLAEPRDDA